MPWNHRSLWALAWPIMIEMFLQFMIGIADTLMVSCISDHAVAVVGISNQFFMSAIVLFMLITGGAGIVIAQKLGARQEQEARTAAVMTVQLTFIIGTLVSLLLYTGAGRIAAWLQIPGELQPLAVTYITVVGSGTMLTSLMLALSTIIRNTGNTKGPMVISLGMNTFHVCLNYLFIFGALGFPEWGLYGVGLSTVISRGIAVILLLVLLRRSFAIPIGWRDVRLFSIPILKDILRIGWPVSLNGASWTFSQISIFAIIASMGALQLATRTYMNTLESFCFLCGMSLSMAAQIRIAQQYGAGQLGEVYRGAWEALRSGLFVVILNTILLVILCSPILHFFTTNQDVIALSSAVLLMNLLLQPAKMFSNAFISSLSAIGDTRFIAVVGISSMWAVSVGLTFVLGVELGWGLYGVYTAMIADELVRSTCYIVRWRSKRRLWDLDRSVKSVHFSLDRRM
ncbi:MATE family efflux transporter [Paenibacillus sp. UNC451MF]|uniref:MATE family efflux transporter n=1 Tax=Paenibacillus sp. UNC451MF TaxID=1449063 RepID=UPI00048DB3E8|nr:MATE family efflux transporter [Paenibacillus sp. UNC451MF]